VFAGLMVFAMGQTILFAVMGPVAREIGMPEWQVGVVIAASALTVMLVSPLWGRLTDRWGRKRVIVAGLAGYGLATLLFAGLLAAGAAGVIGAALAFFALVAARVLYAMASGGIQPAAVALMADLTAEKDRSAGIALVGAAFGIGTVLGPALAAGLVGFGVLTPLFAAAGAALVIAALSAARIVDPPRRNDVTETGGAASGLPPGLLALLSLSFLLYVAIATIQQTAAFYIQDFTGADAVTTARLTGYAFVALAVAMLVVQGGLVQALKPPPGRMVALGLPIAAAGLGLYLAAPSIGWVIAAFALMGAGFGAVQPGISALVSLRTGADAQGRAAGFVQAAMAGGFVVGPLAGTVLYGAAPNAPIWLALGAVAACWLVFLGLRVGRTPTASIASGAQAPAASEV
jgi:MFS family permease